MGASCSNPTAIASAPKQQQPTQEILILVEQINMVSGHSTREMHMLKRMLSRNIVFLKERLEGYEEKIKSVDADPAAQIWRAEKLRTEELIKKMQRMLAPLAYMD